MSCECDIFVFPPPLAISAGRETLARQLGAFPEWRRATLAAIGRESLLDDWHAREAGDLGLMLVDFWAYVCDVISFYDGAIAAESYLRTAALRPSRRTLVGLLGYIPRPAVGAAAALAVMAEGRQTVMLPSGIAFRSTSFDGHPPQVFELGPETPVHPLNNRWPIARVVPVVLDALNTTATVEGFTVVPATLRARPGDLIAVLAGAATRVRTVLRIDPVTTLSRLRLSRIVFASAVSLPGATTYASVDLRKPAARAGVWTLPTATGDPAPIGANTLVLDGLHRGIANGQRVIVVTASASAVMTVSSVEELSRVLLTGLTSTLRDNAGAATGSLVSPDIKVQVTKLTFTQNLPGGAVPSTTSVWYGLTSAGRVVAAPLDTLAPQDPIVIDGLVETPPIAPGRLMLLDVNGAGVEASGQIDFATKAVTLAGDAAWAPPLAAPVTLLGNVVNVTRGETVLDETIGIGDASQAFQTFKLAKKPLTYLPGDGPGGLASTLVIHVDGLLWKETPTFFDVDPADRVYTVRADDEDNAQVTFGGGARLPTGSRVVADYRFGAGRACPPAGTLTQVARPVKGLKSVTNPLTAFGGADREGSEELLAYAPRSALLLGRAVSLPDFEAAAAGVPGVRAVATEWRFSDVAQRPLVHIYYIGDAQLRAGVLTTLQDLSDPTVPIIVEPAIGDLTRVDLAITVRPDYESSIVLNAVRDAVFAPATTPGTGGLLRPERLGVGRALFESWISEAVLQIDGVQSLDGVLINSLPFSSFGLAPPAGHYLDVEAGGVVINGRASYV